MNGASRPVTVFLIHGTFAPNAPWTRPGSRLRRAIEHALADVGPVTFICPEWTGRLIPRLNNSHGARIRAGNAIRSLVRSEASRPPFPRVFLVGHSHGGTMAMYALRGIDPQVVGGVVCLSTPFPLATERPQARFAAQLASSISKLALAGLLALGALGFGMARSEVVHGQQPAERWGAAFLALALLPVMWFRKRDYDARQLGGSSLDPVFDRVLEAVACFREALTLPELPSAKMFVATMPGDEARRWLASVASPHQLLCRLLSWHVMAAVMGAVALVIVCTERSTLAGISADNLMGFFVFGIWVLLRAVVLSASAMTGVLLLASAIAALTRSNPLGFGWESPFVVAGLDVSVHPSPCEDSEVHLITSAGSGMRHSRLYEDEAFLTQMAAWIKAQVALGPPSTPIDLA